MARFPSALPDGKRVLFLVRHHEAAQRGIYVGPVRGGKAVRLADSETAGTYAEPGYLLYPNGGMLIARGLKGGVGPLGKEPFFVGPATGVLIARGGADFTGYATWFTRNGAEEESIGNLGDYSDFRVSPDGRRVLLSLNEGDSGLPEIWLQLRAHNAAHGQQIFSKGNRVGKPLFQNRRVGTAVIAGPGLDAAINDGIFHYPLSILRTSLTPLTRAAR